MRASPPRATAAIDALHVGDRGQPGPLSSEKAKRLMATMRDIGQVIVPERLEGHRDAYIEAFDLSPQVRISTSR